MFLTNQSSFYSVINESSFSILESHIQRALKGNLLPAVYLFKAPCGLGKSSAIQTFLKEWKIAGFKNNESVLIVLQTKDEIRTYIDRADLYSTDYAVYNPDDGLSGLGRGRDGVADAPVLYITHEMFKKRVNCRRADGSRGFKAATEFYYKGHPRSVIIYDETLHRAHPICIAYDTLAALPDHIRSIDPAVTRLLDDAIPNKAMLSSFLSLEVPFALSDGLAKLRTQLEPHLSGRYLSTVDALIDSGGSSLVASQGGNKAWYFVGSCNPLSDDLPPVFVLDGSVGLRATYGAWDTRKGGIVFLDAARVNYRHLTIRWWDRGAGKGTLGNFESRREIVSAVTDLINASPSEGWLVIHPMDRAGFRGFSIPSDVKAGLQNPGNVSFVHWGLHVATNQYRNIKNVIVIGENQYRDHDYDAHYVAASGQRFVGRDNRAATYVGEFGHHVYQGICRSNVRQIVEGVAGAATAYIITVRKPEKVAILERAFEHCTIEPWQPVEGKPPTKAEKMIAELALVFADRNIEEIAIRDLAIRCGGTVGKYLTKQWADEGVSRHLAANGLEKDKNRVFRKPDKELSS